MIEAPLAPQAALARPAVFTAQACKNWVLASGELSAKLNEGCH